MIWMTMKRKRRKMKHDVCDTGVDVCCESFFHVVL